MANKSRTPRLSLNPENEHAFYEMGPRRFEHFCRAIHEAQPGILGANLYGPDGQQQFGIDHIAFIRDGTGNACEVGQAKAAKNFGADKIRSAADDFLNHWDGHWHDKKVRRFILFIGCAVKSRKAGDEVIRQHDRFAEKGVDFQVWDSPAIYDRLPGAPTAVRNYLDQEWYERIFGKPTSPLNDLQRDLARGWDPGAVRVQDYVTRLNQAETAEISELKRRARRGESAQVIVEVEMALRSEASFALADPIRAEKLRLLGGLLMGQGKHDRVAQLLGEADALDGESTRLRAIHLLETAGNEALLGHIADTAPPELLEIRAVALLRQKRAKEAWECLAACIALPDPRSEALRLAALAQLLSGERAGSVDLAHRATQSDPDSRACQQAYAICLFHRALSPALPPDMGEWPQPIDQPMVSASDAARRDLEASEQIFRRLMASPELDDHNAMVMWHFAVMACMPWRHEEVQARLEELQAAQTLPIPLIAWAIARALPFDRGAAALQCDHRLEAEPEDFETLLIRIALANASGERLLARRLLDANKSALEGRGHGDTYAYWSAVLDLDGHRRRSTAAVEAHPALKLRRAMGIGQSKARARALAAVLKEQLEGDSDPRVVLAACQMLLELGWHRAALKAALYLTDTVGTAEATATAAVTFYRNRKPAQVLKALGRPEIFANGKLPLDLERLRSESLAAGGELLLARDASLAIAGTTGHPGDLWRSIRFQLAVGAMPRALALYEEHAKTLAEPTTGHIELARALVQTHPEAARRITRQIAEEAPDDFVGATFELVNKLRMGTEQEALLARIVALGGAGKGGVAMMSMEDILAMTARQREEEARNQELYANGHRPIYFLENLRPATMSALYLEPLLSPPSPGEERMLLCARYGRRFEDEIWPGTRREIKLTMDVTAMLTAHGLGILDKVERAFAPISIAPDAVGSLVDIRSDLEAPRPERLLAASRLLSRLDGGQFAVKPLAQGEVGLTLVLQGETSMARGRVSLSKLLEQFEAAKGQTAADRVRSELGGMAPVSLEEVPVPSGSALALEPSLAIVLEEAGLMSWILGDYRVSMIGDTATFLKDCIHGGERISSQIDALSSLITSLNNGIEDGTYHLVPFGEDLRPDRLRRSFRQGLNALSESDGVVWIDDRCVSSIDDATFKTATTIEILDLLVREGRLDRNERNTLRQRLRSARWLFFPFNAAEIVSHLRSAARNGEVTITPDLRLLRQSIGLCLVHRRRLQWPDPVAMAKGLNGEVPFLLDNGHAIREALVQIWSDPAWLVEDAQAACEWMIDTLEMSFFPRQGMAADDPRVDETRGVHLGSLILAGIQIMHATSEERATVFLEWVWAFLGATYVQFRPEIRAGMEWMIAKHLERDDGDDAKRDRLWRSYTGRFVNGMPLALRTILLDNPEIRRIFDLPDHGQVILNGESYDEAEFFGAVIAAQANERKAIKAQSGAEAVIDIDTSHAAHPHRLTVAGASFHIDDWPERVSSQENDIRAQALRERQELLDLGKPQLDDLNAQLGKEVDRVMRVRRVLTRTTETLKHGYRDLEDLMKEREGIGPAELAMPDVGVLLNHLRLKTNLDEATTTLLAEHGLAVAIRRLGALPIAPPQPLFDAVQALPGEAAAELYSQAQIDNAPPWIKLFMAQLLLSRSADPELVVKARQCVADALQLDTTPFWELFIELATSGAAEVDARPMWRGLSATQQLAACYVHANALCEILVSGGLVVTSLSKFLRENRLLSPRFLVEPLTLFDHDVAEPRHLSVDRLRGYAAAPVLLKLRTFPDHEAWATAALVNLGFEDGEGDERQPRLNITCGALAADDALGSFLAASLSADVEGINANMAGLLRGRLPDMLKLLLDADPERLKGVATLQIMRLASGDNPLPTQLHDQLRTLMLEGDCGFDTPEAGGGAFELMNFAAMAAVHGWSELGERIDQALDRLAPNTEGDEIKGLLEAGVWRARLEPDRLARTQCLAGILTRLSRWAKLADHAETAARHFALYLSGREADCFVDALGTILTQEPWPSQ